MRRLLGSAREADVDDLVQDTIVRAMTTPPDTSRPVRGWLATVARNLFRERYRSEKRRSNHEGSAPPRAPLPTPDEAALLAERHQVLVECVRGLPEPYRHTLLVHYLREIPLREIAEHLGEPLATIRSRLQRGRELLRDALRLRFEEQGEDWAAALLPLAGWPDGIPPAGPPPSDGTSGGASGGSLSVPWAAALVVGAGLILATAWWGDWFDADTVVIDPASATADEVAADAAGPDRRRAGAAPERGDAAERADAGAAADAGAPPAEPPREHGVPPHGSFRVVVDGLPDDLDSAPELLILPFLATNAQTVAVGPIDPARVLLESAVVDLDLAELFGPELDVADVEVILRHPRILLTRARATPAREGDPGLPAVLSVTPAATAAGHVLDADGDPVAGAMVLVGVDDRSASGTLVRSVVDDTETGPDGRFAVALPPGRTVRILARAPGHEPSFETLSAQAAGDTIAADVALGRGHRIAGRLILDESLDPTSLRVSAGIHQYDTSPYRGRAGIVVVEGGHALQSRAESSVASDGTFVLEGLSAREYNVAVDTPAGVLPRPETVRVVRSAPLEGLEIDQRLRSVPFVVSSDGVPLAGATVLAESDPSTQPAFGRTDDDGRVTLHVLRGSDLAWDVSAPGAARRIGNALPFRDTGTTPITFDVGPLPDATWAVRLHYSDGNPVRHAAFVTVPSGDDPMRHSSPIEVDGVDGLFELSGLPRGPQKITIRIAAGWWDSRTYWADIPCDVNLPERGPPEWITVSERGGRIRISAHRDDVAQLFAFCTVSRDGVRVPCAFAFRSPVRARNSGSSVQGHAPADLHPVLPPGEYELHLTSRGCHDEHRTVTVVEGKVTDVEVTFRPK